MHCLCHFYLITNSFFPLILCYTLHLTVFLFYHPCSTSSCNIALKYLPFFQINSSCLDVIETAPFFAVFWAQGWPSAEPHSKFQPMDSGILFPLLLLHLPRLAYYCLTTLAEYLKHTHTNNLEPLLQKLLLLHSGDFFRHDMLY